MSNPYLQHMIDRLFARLTAVYGREFTGKFDGTTVDAVKAAWANELRGFEKNFEAIAWALDNLPEKCPNAVQFKFLCRRAPNEQRVAMERNEAPTRGPTAAEREALRSLADDLRNPRRLNRDWAYALIHRHENGDPRPAACVTMARAAIANDPNRRFTASAPAAEDEQRPQ